MNQPAGKLRRPLAIVAGVRTPFAKAWGSLADLPADELGRLVTVTALERSQLQPRQVDEVIFGNVSGPAESANIARVIALKAGIPETRIAHTVHRNCASGMEAIIAGWQAIETGRAETVVAGGTESMSRVPLLWDPRMQSWLMRWERERSLWGRLKQLARLRPSWLRPIAGLSLGLTDPVSGLKMGQTAEVVARDFGITREAQDAFALASHHKAIAAWKRCFLGGETLAMPLAGVTDGRVGLTQDNGPRTDTSLEKLARLKPIFERDGTRWAIAARSPTEQRR
jgi:acetyl-CoA acetyltransferase family protein